MELGAIHKPNPQDGGRTGATFLYVLPRRIVQYRELRRVTQKDLAAATRISKSTLNRIEGGQMPDMLVSTLESICHGLSVTPDALTGYDGMDLVRTPALAALDVRRGGHSPAAWRCETCEAWIAARALHLPGECMMTLADNGSTAARIAAVFGLTERTVESALREEHEARRHRRF